MTDEPTPRNGYAPRRASDPPHESYGPPQVPLVARPWVTLLQTVGFPTALVIFFLAQQAGYVPSEARGIIRALDDHNLTMKTTEERRVLEMREEVAAKKLLAESIVRLAAGLDANNRVTRAICTSQSGQADVRRACLGAREE